MVQMYQCSPKCSFLLNSFYRSCSSHCTCLAGAFASSDMVQCIFLSGNGCSASEVMKTWIFSSAPVQRADNIWNKTPVAKGQSWGQSILGCEEADTEKRFSDATVRSQFSFEEAFPASSTQTHFSARYSQIRLFAVMESCDCRKRNMLLWSKSVQAFAITFRGNVLRHSNGWQCELLKCRAPCSEVLAEPAGQSSCTVPVPGSPAVLRARAAAARPLTACLRSDTQKGRRGRRCDVFLPFLTLSRLAKWDCWVLLPSRLT